MPKTSTKAFSSKVDTGSREHFEQGYRLEDQVGFLLRRAYLRASSNLVARIGSYDLTAPQFAPLKPCPATLPQCSTNRVALE